MEFIRKLPNAEELKNQYALTEQQKQNRIQCIKNIEDVLSGAIDKKIVCIGPCSADNEKAVLEYAVKLAKMQEDLDNIIIIPRVYTSKPRTTGQGYKGLLHRPDLSIGMDDIYDGLVAMRKLHLHVIQETGLFSADEMLYPEAHYYISDLLAYTAVGARSVENQQHRLVSSGIETPVGMKNPTSGDTEVMLNAILAAQSKQNLLYHGWECRTEGNLFAHAILRGYTDASGKMHSNYHYEDLCDLNDIYIKMNLRNVSVIVDCNHGNSRKHYDEQIRISKELFQLCKLDNGIDRFLKGLMIESYLVDGMQMIGEGIYGKSVTDPCLGWKKTEYLLRELDEILDEKKGARMNE